MKSFRTNRPRGYYRERWRTYSFKKWARYYHIHSGDYNGNSTKVSPSHIGVFSKANYSCNCGICSRGYGPHNKESYRRVAMRDRDRYEAWEDEWDGIVPYRKPKVRTGPRE
ncbi:MAG: hypothetical protein ACRC5C_08865 [Bacilli bacterium]